MLCSSPQTRGGRGATLDGREHRHGGPQALPQHRQGAGDEPAHPVQQLAVKGENRLRFPPSLQLELSSDRPLRCEVPVAEAVLVGSLAGCVFAAIGDLGWKIPGQRLRLAFLLPALAAPATRRCASVCLP